MKTTAASMTVSPSGPWQLPTSLPQLGVPFRTGCFSDLLVRAGHSSAGSGAIGLDRGGTGQPEADQGTLREAVRQFVATALLTPLLSELRRQPLDSGLFHGGFAEDVFRQQIDSVVVDRMARSQRFPVADQLYGSFARALSRSHPPVNVYG